MTEKEKQLHSLLYGEEKLKRKAGKPPIALADTFDQAMLALKPEESQFVRHVLAGDPYAVAYSKVKPHAAPQTRLNRGSFMAARKAVAHALSLGKRQGALAAITGLAYDVRAADSQLVQLIDEARKFEQYSAVSNLVRERLKLHKLTDSAPSAVAGASFTLVIKAADGSEQTLTPGHVIDVTPTENRESSE